MAKIKKEEKKEESSKKSRKSSKASKSSKKTTGGKKSESKGGTPTYYCSVSQKMWCKVEKADKASGGKFNLHYDCAGKKRKVSIGCPDARVDSGKAKPTKACGEKAMKKEEAKIKKEEKKEEE